MRRSELPKGDKSKVYLFALSAMRARDLDVTDPAKPGSLTTIIKGLKGTHKNWWECDSGIATSSPDRRLARAAHDPGVRPLGPLLSPSSSAISACRATAGIAGPDARRSARSHSTGPKGNRIYFGYSTNKDGVLQIVDRESS